MLDEKSHNFLPEVDPSMLLPYRDTSHVLRIERLHQKHALMLQRAFQRGTEHIAGYFAWAEHADRWNTRQVLSYINSLVKQELPNEHYVFILGKRLVGLGSLMSNGTSHRDVQMAYYVCNGYTGMKLGQAIAQTMHSLAFVNRPYERVFINHDSSNRHSGAIPQALGYKFEGVSDAPIHAKRETGLWYNWQKTSNRYADCPTERTKDLRFADLYCQMINQMHPAIYAESYESVHRQAIREFQAEKLQYVRSKFGQESA